MANGLRRDNRAHEFVCFWGVACRSFSVPKVSQKCSQLIHIGSFSALPAGLRLEIATKIDKKKTELYFSSPRKIS
jgi:hypothetical protein